MVTAYVHTLYWSGPHSSKIRRNEKIDVNVGITYNLICGKLKLLYDLFFKKK